MNSCENNIWFVVELCESIKAVKMELANFELYSSVPHEFRVTMSNVYPAKEKDWALFGQFKAENDRSVQTFATDGQGVFGKYARVEILSHHGNEQLCLVSHFKMFGVSEIDLLGGDDDDDDDDPETAETGLEDSTFEEELTTTATPPKANGIVSFLKEKVDETIERFVGVFRPRRDDAELISTALNESSLSGNTLAHQVQCPDCDRERYREVYFILASEFDVLSRTLRISSLTRSLEEGVCDSLGFKVPPVPSAVCAASLVSEFYRTLFGSSRTMALCNVMAITRKELPRVLVQAEHTSPSCESPRNDLDAQPETNTKVGTGTDQVQKPPDDQSSSALNSGVTKGDTDSGVSSGTTPDSKASIDDDKIQIEGHDSPTVKKDSDAKSGATSVPPAPTGQHPSKNRGNPAADLKDPPPVVHVEPVVKDGPASPPGAAPPSSPSEKVEPPSLPSAPTTSARDTPWQKLSNKIKVYCYLYIFNSEACQANRFLNFFPDSGAKRDIKHRLLGRAERALP